MTGEFPFREELRKRLVEAAVRRNSRKKRRKVFGTSIAFFAASGFAVLMLQLLPTPSQAAVLKITADNDLVTVTIADLSASPEKVVKELRKTNLSLEVKEGPAPASLKGKFFFISGQQGENEQVHLNPDKNAISFDKRTKVTIIVGRLASAGEEYDAALNSFSVGGKLHCSNLKGKPVSAAIDQINQTGFDIRWTVVGPDGGQVDPTKVPNAIVSGAEEIGTDKMLVTLTAADGITRSANKDETFGC